MGQKYAMRPTPAKNAGRISQGSCTSTPASVMLTTAPAVVSASRSGSLRQVQTLLGCSARQAMTGAENVGIWTVHATTNAVIVPSRRTRTAASARCRRQLGPQRLDHPGRRVGQPLGRPDDAHSRAPAQRGAAAAAAAGGNPRMVTTAVVPIRNGCSGSRSSRRTRTWKRLPGAPSQRAPHVGQHADRLAVVGSMAHPMPCTVPRNDRCG